ncbi:GTPase ObgE, partial [Candidatus Roizmanbacteria bacterium]|nr:GTPase ObgE [Candidatus Roizmanbacteria bacterium]
MFVDEAQITVKGGDGGPGKVAFFAKKKGPSGGNGGKGGDLYFAANSNIKDLKKFKETIFFKAENGQQGGSNRRFGGNGKDLHLMIPINTTIVDENTNEEITLTEIRTEVLLCRGGEGGFGNNSFKTSTNQTPYKATPGKKGQEKKVKLILRLIADLGLIGLPNAGKSSLLNELTKANVRTAAYPFTTLEPNLGVLKGKVIADIPGLIEGAAKGKGLGIRFLKHIEKVSLLLHCISVESNNIERDYKTVIEEISKYNKAILSKKAIILLTKIDLVSQEMVKDKIKTLKKFHEAIIPVSIYDLNSLTLVRQI